MLLCTRKEKTIHHSLYCHDYLHKESLFSIGNNCTQQPDTTCSRSPQTERDTEALPFFHSIAYTATVIAGLESKDRLL